jgi:hypothetical protein
LDGRLPICAGICFAVVQQFFGAVTKSFANFADITTKHGIQIDNIKIPHRVFRTAAPEPDWQNAAHPEFFVSGGTQKSGCPKQAEGFVANKGGSELV